MELWIVTRDSECDPPEYFGSEEEALKNACLGLPTTRVRRILTSEDRPPIPTTAFDWSAWVDGDEEFAPFGHGRTEAEAIADLKEHLNG